VKHEDLKPEDQERWERAYAIFEKIHERVIKEGKNA